MWHVLPGAFNGLVCDVPFWIERPHAEPSVCALSKAEFDCMCLFISLFRSLFTFPQLFPPLATTWQHQLLCLMTFKEKEATLGLGLVTTWIRQAAGAAAGVKRGKAGVSV